jgi:hypothetical protein
MSKKVYSIEKYNINPADFKDDLSEYYKRIYSKKSSLSQILLCWGSVENYVNFLYWLKFVKKLNWSEMARYTGIHGISNNYYSNGFGWHYDIYDLKECERHYANECVRLKQIYNEFDSKSLAFCSKEFTDFLNRPRQALGKCNYLKIGINAEEDFIKLLYYLCVIRGLTPYETAIAIGKTYTSTYQILRKLGMTMDPLTAQRQCVKNGKKNYSKISTHSREETINNMLRTGLVGSKVENVLRTLIDNKLSEVIDLKRYEFVVGINSRNIISPREIDIPIVIIDKYTNKLYKIAVEYNGEYWHQNVIRDKNKKEILANAGWEYIEVDVKNNESPKSIKEKCSVVCETINLLLNGKELR